MEYNYQSPAPVPLSPFLVCGEVGEEQRLFFL